MLVYFVVSKVRHLTGRF